MHPDTPEEGLQLKELFAGRNVDINEMMTRLREAADEAGLPLGKREKTFNSRLAQELGKWAEGKGKGDRFHNAVFRAYFVDGKNIGKIPALAELAESVSLPAEEAREVLESRAFKQAVDQDWSRSHAMGVTAVPTFVMNSQTAVGAQPYETLEQLMKASGVRRREP